MPKFQVRKKVNAKFINPSKPTTKKVRISPNTSSNVVISSNVENDTSTVQGTTFVETCIDNGETFQSGAPLLQSFEVCVSICYIHVVLECHYYYYHVFIYLFIIW